MTTSQIRTITKFKLVEGVIAGTKGEKVFENNVNDHLKAGWKLHGHPFLVAQSIGSGAIFGQAMTTEEPTI